MSNKMPFVMAVCCGAAANKDFPIVPAKVAAHADVLRNLRRDSSCMIPPDETYCVGLKYLSPAFSNQSLAPKPHGSSSSRPTWSPAPYKPRCAPRCRKLPTQLPCPPDYENFRW